MSTGVLGAGPSGLAMAMFLRDDLEVLERADHPGGVASTTIADGFTFDNGPHIMFSKNQAVLDFMIASLGPNVHRCRRKNQISFKGRLTKYPFENDLSSLPAEDTFECLRDYVINPYRERYAEPSNLEQWFLHHFGTALCEKYLFPYNEKVWNVPVAALSMLWADRIPMPKPEDVLRSALGFETEGYVHQLFYHYPLHGGYQAISEAWARDLPVTYGFDVTRVERRPGGGFAVSDGTATRTFDRLVSTLPVHDLIDLVGFEVPTEVREAVGRLIVNPLIVVSLGIRGEDPEQRTAVYFPERDLLFNRVSYPTTFSPHNAPEGAHSIQAEITCRADSPTWAMADDAVRDHVVDGLVARGLIADPADVVYASVHREPYAYVVYDVGYERSAELVRTWFRHEGIELVGRFAFFEYVNVDGAVERAQSVATRLNDDGADPLARVRAQIGAGA